MRLKPNTFYITSGGQKAYIFGLNPFFCDEGTDWVGVVDGGDEECWTVEGKYFADGTPSTRDIAEEWG